jgi:hypothetical protein
VDALQFKKGDNIGMKLTLLLNKKLSHISKFSCSKFEMCSFSKFLAEKKNSLAKKKLVKIASINIKEIQHITKKLKF